MAYFKKQTKGNGLGQRTIFSNTHEGKTNPIKQWYAFIEINGKDHIDTYEGKFRSEAVAYFQESARLVGGKYNGNLHALKN